MNYLCVVIILFSAGLYKSAFSTDSFEKPVCFLFVFFSLFCVEFDVIFRSFIKRKTSGTSSSNEWQRVGQWVTMNDSNWQRMTTRGTTSGRTSDSKWYNEWQRVTMRVYERQQMTANDNELLFLIIFLFLKKRGT